MKDKSIYTKLTLDTVFFKLTPETVKYLTSTLTPLSRALLPHHPMPFVAFVLIRDAWEICLWFCK